MDNSFFQNFLAGAQLADREHEMQQQAEEHKLIVQQHKLALDTAKLEQAKHLREIQAMQSGGPITQPPPSVPDTITPAAPSPDLAPSIADILTQIRQKPVAAQNMPINPLPGPNIPVALSTGMVTIPGTNREMANAEAAQRAQAEEQAKLATQVHPGSEFGLYTGTGRQIAPPAAPKDKYTQGPLGVLDTATGVLQPAPEKPIASTPSNNIKDYLFYVSDEQKAGRKPLSFDAWMTREANRKVPTPGAPATILIHTVDENGNPVQKVVPKVAGATFGAAPTAQTQNRREQADIILREADRIIGLIDKTPNAVGPVVGRLALGQTVIGTVAPEAKALGTALGSFEALQPILHGFRGGGQTVEHFHSVLGDQTLNAAALKASLLQIKALASDIRGGKAVEEGAAPSTGWKFVGAK